MQGSNNNYSELAQFIYVDKVPRRFAEDGERDTILYREILKNAFELVTSKKSKEQKNNVARQLSEAMTFKRNVMGSFLDNVNKEFLARKSKENSKEDIKGVLSTLCSKIHDFGLVLGDEAKAEGDEKINACVDIIMSKDDDNDNLTASLAYSSSDNEYEISNCSAIDSDNSYYDTIFCMLNDMKEEKLSKAKGEFAKIKASFSAEEKELVSERINEIQAYIDSFEEDKKEEAVIQPGFDKAKTHAAILKAKADRNGALNAAESALISMDNQNRNTAYCPVY